jgi:uncharacterized protein YkwD
MRTQSVAWGAAAVLVMGLACGDEYIPPDEPLIIDCAQQDDPSCEGGDQGAADQDQPDQGALDQGQPDQDQPDQDAPDMSAPDQAPDMDAPPPMCSRQEALCGGECVNTQQDEAHCGRCDRACGGGESCMSGSCVQVSVLARIVAIANEHRASGYNCGGQQMPPVGPLVMSAELQRAAQLHAQDMADNNYFDHTSLDGRSFSARSRDAGYTGSPTGENIAAGNSTPEATMQQWMSSPGHCRNIMSGSSNEIGVGHGLGGRYGHYWVQKFGWR